MVVERNSEILYSCAEDWDGIGTGTHRLAGDGELPLPKRIVLGV